MNQETRTMPVFGPGGFVDASMAPTNALSTRFLRGLSVLRQKYEKRSAERKRDKSIAFTIRELSRLDERLLRDIGISRGDIHAVAIAVVDNPNVNVQEIVGH